jgi:hypothetical protein
MRCFHLPRSAVLLFLAFTFGCTSTPRSARAEADLPNGDRIEKLSGLKGKMDTGEGVFKVSFPRSDLKVESTGVSISPPLGLTAWAAFKNTGKQSMVMGDIVLTENQVNAVMDAALNNGLEVTALHNHFLWEQPRIMFMHVGGMGSEESLAKSIGAVFNKLKETIQAPPKSPATSFKIEPKDSNIDVKHVAQIVGADGELNNGVYKITIGRSTKMHGYEMGKAMGVNTWAAFAGRDQEAVVDGDFAMLEDEVQAVLKALRGSGINIVSIHNHMTMETPRIVFLHYWGIGPVEQLAKGVRKALDTQGR